MNLITIFVIAKNACWNVRMNTFVNSRSAELMEQYKIKTSNVQECDTSENNAAADQCTNEHYNKNT